MAGRLNDNILFAENYCFRIRPFSAIESMPLPNEIRLDVFACVDYGTLTAGWFTTVRISRLIRGNMERLALHRRLTMRTRAGAYGSSDIIVELRELDSGASLGEFLYVHDLADPHTDVLQRLKEKVSVRPRQPYGGA